MKTSTVTQVLMLVFGALLVIAGILLFATPGLNAALLGYAVCALMLVFGAAKIVFYCVRRKARAVSGWMLADGIITAALALFLLFVPGAQILTMAVIFAVWVLFTGIMSFSEAFADKDAGLGTWGWNLALGTIGTLLGIWLMFDPVLSITSIGFLLPIALIFEGVAAIAFFFTCRTKTAAPRQTML